MDNWIDIAGIIANSLLSCIAIGVSVWVFIYSKKSNQTTFELGIYQMIQNAKINLDEKTHKLIDANRELEYVLKVITPPIETYLDALDNACSLYFSNEINRKRFSILFSKDIKNIFSNSVYEKTLENNRLYYLKKFNNNK